MSEWFGRAIIKWYKKSARDLPWRHETDAYKIWLSEVILQQTQVVQGLSYYNRFVAAYPKITHLARASEDEVLKMWQGLGYYSRARNLLKTAQTVAKEYTGVFPSDFEQIRSLKGIGDYTAAAIASFAFNKPHAVVDGNVYRLLSRVFGIETPINTTNAKKEFSHLAQELLNKKQPGTYNQAIMEFGSRQCRPQNPECETCVLSEKCLAFKNKRVSELPVKAKKNKVRKRYLHYFFIRDRNNNTLIKRREGKDIWQGLYDFPLIETKQQLNESTVMLNKEVIALCGTEFEIVKVSSIYKHTLSHQLLMARFYEIKVWKIKDRSGMIRTNHKNLTSFAFPKLIEKFLGDCGIG